MDVAVVGAGIMGRTLAFELAKAGKKVSIYAGVVNNTCSMAAAGLLTPLSELEISSPLICEMGYESLNQHWPAMLAHLKTAIYFQRSGSLALSHPQDSAELYQFINRVNDKLKSLAYPYSYKKLSKSEIVALEPEFAKFDEAYYFPDEAHVDSQQIMTVLKKFLDQEHVEWHPVSVDEISPGQIRVDNQVKTFDQVFDCRGLGAKSQFPQLRGVRGELIWLQASEVKIQCPIRFHHPRYDLYIVPRPEQIYLLGASEIETENYEPISVRTSLELLTAAYYLHPGFSEAKILKTVTQCRPTFPDSMPKIKYEEGLIAINGLYRHGFLLAPTLAAEVLRWLKRGRSSLHYPQIGEFL